MHSSHHSNKSCLFAVVPFSFYILRIECIKLTYKIDCIFHINMKTILCADNHKLKIICIWPIFLARSMLKIDLIKRFFQFVTLLKMWKYHHFIIKSFWIYFFQKNGIFTSKCKQTETVDRIQKSTANINIIFSWANDKRVSWKFYTTKWRTVFIHRWRYKFLHAQRFAIDIFSSLA